MSAPRRFRLRFDPALIPALAEAFGEVDESRASSAGARARGLGHYTREDFLTVYRWKAARSEPRAAVSDEATIVAATARSFAALEEAARFEALTVLPGVGGPVASALLHFAFPEGYPILDVRALESLGVKARSVYPTAFWVEYVEYCRELAPAHGVSLRTLDKALWQYSKGLAAQAAHVG